MHQTAYATLRPLVMVMLAFRKSDEEECDVCAEPNRLATLRGVTKEGR